MTTDKATVPTRLASPLCIALDTPDLDRARALVREVGEAAGLVKIGMEFFYAHGAVGYDAIAAEGAPIFLDLKLHDIPNTVHAAIASLMRLETPPAMIDIHATGGPAMMQAATRAVRGRSKVIAVTVLTSLGDEDLADVGFDPATPAAELVVSMALMAKECGLDGVVCSPIDLPAVRAACGPKFLTVVPGLRPAHSDSADQKRVSTPAEAWAAGADVLVVGRPVTAAQDPAAAARDILASLGEKP